jgi:uncharacterized protein
MSPYRTPGEPGQQRGPGGTSGGTGQFLFGIGMLVAGIYLFLDSVQVTTGFGSLFGWGRGSFGLSLIPLLAGIGFLFFDGKSIVGWGLTGAGLLIVIVGVVARMDVYFHRTSLFETLMMLGLIAGGVGLVARSLRAHN